MPRHFRYFLEYIGYLIVEKLVFWLPNSLVALMADFLAFLIYKVFKIRREVALANLKIAFPDKPVKTLEKIAYQSYKHFTLVGLEFMKLSRWKIFDLQKMLEIETPEILERLSEKEQGVILISAHFGSWEIGFAYLSKTWKPAAGILKRQKNRLVDRRMAKMRHRWGIKIIYTRGAVHRVLRALRENRFVGILSDQDAGKSGAFVPFFGRLASTPTGPAILHLKSQAPIVWGYVIRVGKFRYKLGLVSVPYHGDYRINRANVNQITAIYTRLAEHFISRYPEQYFWMHRRWKTTSPKT